MSAIVIKLGSSIVASDDGTVRLDVLSQICDQVAELQRGGLSPVVVTSGAIAHGLGALGISPTARPRAIDELQAASAVGQGKLYQVYDGLLAARGVASAQVLLTFFDISGGRGNYLNARQTLHKLLEWGVVPVINENDTTTTDEISFGNNDFLAAQLAILLGAGRLLLLTDAAGVFTADPRSNTDAVLLSSVSDIEADLAGLAIGHQTSALGSGGMRSKIVAAEMATAAGIPTVIAGGLEPGVITDAAAGRAVGTTFAAQAGRYSSFKLWLRYAKPTRGVVEVDSGAARALRDDGTSLLPVGVVEVNGSFDAGDAIEVTHDSVLVGKGICNYSAEELRQVRGLKSAAVREKLPRAAAEAVHRDYFVLV